MNTEKQINWRLGVDVGNNSIGLAAVKYINGSPKEILAAVSFIHDGGKDPDGQVSDSRKKVAGIARRTRRLRRRKKARLTAIKTLLESNGIFPRSNYSQSTYQCWEARRRLISKYVKDDELRSQLLWDALTHIAKYRGWRNSWKSTETLEHEQFPSSNLSDMQEEAVKILELDSKPRTIGELGALTGNKLMRNRQPSKKPENNAPKNGQPIFSKQILQVDTYNEVKLICNTQHVDDKLTTEILHTIFDQIKPYVPKSNVGKCSINPNEYRASIATLEFQENRILQKLGDMRIEGRPLTCEEYRNIYDYLSGLKTEEITWAEVADDILNVEESQLNLNSEKVSAICPRLDSLKVIGELLKGKKPSRFKDWWNNANEISRANFISVVADPVEEMEQDDEVDQFLDSLGDEELEAIGNLNFNSGRAAYSRNTLRSLNDYMKENCCDLTTALKGVFNIGDNWMPPMDSFDIPTGQPAVDRNIEIIRKFLSSASLKWGKPTSIVVEIARDAAMGPEKKKAVISAQRKRADFNARLRTELKAQGIGRPEKGDIWKYLLYNWFDSTCLYCGEALSDFKTAELDHVVPRSDGGSNVEANLALVCRKCNADKSNLPFAIYAKSRGKNLVEVLNRVKQLKYADCKDYMPYPDKKAFESYKNNLIRRLKRKSPDEDIDDQNIQATSYAARAIRERLNNYLGVNDKSSQNLVQVYSGFITHEARDALNIQTDIPMYKLLENRKDRFDRRHHALDALILLTITPVVAQVLVERRTFIGKHRLNQTMSYKDVLAKFPKGYVVNTQEVFKKWENTTSDYVKNLIIRHFNEDKVAVINPLRLRPSIGSLHRDTVNKLKYKDSVGQWSRTEISRIVNKGEYLSYLNFLEDKADIEVDENLLSRMPINLKNLDNRIAMFPEPAAMISIQGGAAELSYIHHARLYAYRNGSGIKYGIIRVFGGEFGKIGFLKPNVDIFTHELPKWCESYRTAEPSLLKQIEKGDAKQIGWLSTGDEIEFKESSKIPGSGKIQDFFKLFPVSRWRVDGFMSPTKLRLRPLYLSAEVLTKAKEIIEKDEEEKVDDTSGEILTVDHKITSDQIGLIKTHVDLPGWLPAVNVLFEDESVSIIRRSYLGVPRWDQNSPLPISWSPSKIAKKLI